MRHDASNRNSVILKLNTVRHYQFVKDQVPFRQKQALAVWRGKSNRQHRIDIATRFVDHPLCDIGCTLHKEAEMQPYHKDFMMLPGLNGFELCKRMRQDLKCNTPVIFMTAKGALPDKEEGFELGGDDYLVKPFALRELQLRIDALSRRRVTGNAELTAGDLSYDPDTLEARYRGLHTVELSGASCRILEALIRSHPKFVSHEDLSNVIWGIEDGDTHTLRTHVYTLRKTLQKEFGHSMVRSIHGRGYRLELPHSGGGEITK